MDLSPSISLPALQVTRSQEMDVLPDVTDTQLSKEMPVQKFLSDEDTQAQWRDIGKERKGRKAENQADRPLLWRCHGCGIWEGSVACNLTCPECEHKRCSKCPVFYTS